MAGQGPFEVDHSTLHTAANDVRTVRSEVDADLKRLWAVVDDLAVAWQGQASTGFQSLINRWDGDAKKLLLALDDIATLLDRSGTTHQVNDEQQQEMLDRIHATLNPGN
jgi:WXG100 family type VII secretion target